MKFKNLLKKKIFYTTFVCFVLLSSLIYFVPIHAFVKGLIFYYCSGVLYRWLLPKKKISLKNVKPTKTILQFKHNLRHNFLFYGSDNLYSKSFDSISIINRPIQEIITESHQSATNFPFINFKSLPSNFINFN